MRTVKVISLFAGSADRAIIAILIGSPGKLTMLDYVLFDETLCRRFGDAVAELGLTYEIDDDPMGGYVIRVLGEIGDDAAAALEAHYDELMTEQQDLIENGGDGQAVMGVDVVLADGQQLSIRLPAVFARRLHEHFDIDEIRELVAVIAEEAVHPQSGPLCCRSRSDAD